MGRKKYNTIILLLSFGLILLLSFRYRIVNRIQMIVIRSIEANGPHSNAIFINKQPGFENHSIYRLPGIDKLLPHRVNSLERFRYLYDQFEGFECDIRIDPVQRAFYIAHDPEEISSLTFKRYLENDMEHKLFWLDVKNLDANTVSFFLSNLDFLNNRYGLKDRIIVESGNPYFLKRVAASGYLTSLYLPGGGTFNDLSGDALFCAYLNDTDGLISQEAIWLDLMSLNFPERKKLVWDLSFKTSLNTRSMRRYVQDTTVLLCLINIKSPGYR